MAAKKTRKSKGTSKKITAKPTKAKVNKSEFIRSHSNLKPAEIVALAKRQGITLSLPMVYTIRSSDKNKMPIKTKVAGTDIGNGRTSGKDYRAQFREAVIELGATEAQRIFTDILNKVRAVK